MIQLPSLFEPYQLPDKIEINNRVDWKIHTDEIALLVCDMQNYFIKAIPDSHFVRSLILNIKSIVEACRVYGIPIIYTMQVPQTAEERGLIYDFWGGGMKDQGDDSKIISDLAPDNEHDHITINKKYSAFMNTDLESYLDRIDKSALLIVGVYGHAGCLATVHDCFMRNIKAFVISDGIGDFSYDYHMSTLKVMANSCAYIMQTKELIEICGRRIS